ncbi:MAG TPA: peptidylprolyl isomerase [Puia sp.]|nr:peptidylprolyl isomerase [Puia sp.]
MRYVYATLALFYMISCMGKKYTNPRVEIETRSGDIEVELFAANAPRSVAAFLSRVDSGYYKNASFYRALNEDNQPTGNAGTAILQGGVWRSKHNLLLPGIPHEDTRQTKLTHSNGTISFARGAPGSAATEFFICVGDQPGFDYGGTNNPDGQGYAAFGRVVRGMDLIIEWHNQPTNGDQLERPIDIVNIVRL